MTILCIHFAAAVVPLARRPAYGRGPDLGTQHRLHKGEARVLRRRESKEGRLIYGCTRPTRATSGNTGFTRRPAKRYVLIDVDRDSALIHKRSPLPQTFMTSPRCRADAYR